MKTNYTIASAKSMVTRNGGKIEGKAIIIQFPGIKVLGAIDFLKAAGYYWKKVIPEPKKKKSLFPESLKSLNAAVVKAAVALRAFAKLMKGEND